MYHLIEIANPFDLEWETKGFKPFSQIEDVAELGLLTPVLRLKIAQEQTFENLVILAQLMVIQSPSLLILMMLDFELRKIYAS